MSRSGSRRVRGPGSRTRRVPARPATVEHSSVSVDEHVMPEQSLPQSNHPLARPLVDALRTIVDLRQQLHDLQHDRNSYRELAQQAIHSLAGLTARYERQKVRYHALLDELRAMRERRAA